MDTPDGARAFRDALTSNVGHLLWNGIVDKSKAATVVRHLMGPRMFTGWGIRTMAQGDGRYNPIGYHVGTIWPFDNSFIAWGLRRYGFKREAAAVATEILQAAECFDGVPHGLQSPGVVNWCPAALDPRNAGARARWRPPDR
jgi:glycogen debranching enzyme